MTLIRNQFLKCGIFGELVDQLGMHVACTLEHSYGGPLFDHFMPKVPEGEFQCVRGVHQLVGMTHSFETFEVTGVPGHTGLLFHAGNFNSNSIGCILVGETIEKLGGVLMVTNSKIALEKFMDIQSGIDSFLLTVINKEGLTIPSAA